MLFKLIALSSKVTNTYDALAFLATAEQLA